jgi:hypothetical protein
MQFAALGYYDETRLQTISPDEQSAMIEACLAYDDELMDLKQWSDGGQALAPANAAKTLRRRDGQLLVTDGPFAETKEQLGGFGVLIADDMNHAVAIMQKHPGTRFGPFEIRPIDEPLQERHTTAPLPAPASPPVAQEGKALVVALGYHGGEWQTAMSASDQQGMLEGSVAFYQSLRASGQFALGLVLQSIRTAKTVRAAAGKVFITDGPFAETKEHLGGVIVLRAKDLAAAVEQFSQHPCLEFGVTIELRPVDEAFTAFAEARKQRLRS